MLLTVTDCFALCQLNCCFPLTSEKLCVSSYLMELVTSELALLFICNMHFYALDSNLESGMIFLVLRVGIKLTLFS